MAVSKILHAYLACKYYMARFGDARRRAARCSWQAPHRGRRRDAAARRYEKHDERRGRPRPARARRLNTASQLRTARPRSLARRGNEGVEITRLSDSARFGRRGGASLRVHWMARASPRQPRVVGACGCAVKVVCCGESCPFGGEANPDKHIRPDSPARIWTPLWSAARY